MTLSPLVKTEVVLVYVSMHAFHCLANRWHNRTSYKRATSIFSDCIYLLQQCGWCSILACLCVHAHVCAFVSLITPKQGQLQKHYRKSVFDFLECGFAWCADFITITW